MHVDEYSTASSCHSAMDVKWLMMIISYELATYTPVAS